MLPANASFRRRGAAALTYPQKMMELGPLAYWRMNIASGDAIPDESTAGIRGATIQYNGGTVTRQEASLIPGQPANKCIHFTNNWIEIPNANASIAFTGFTYVFVMKPQDFNLTNTIFHMGDTSVSNNQGFLLNFNNAEKFYYQYFASAAWRTGASTAVYGGGYASVMHIAVRFPTNLSMEIYVNGALFESFTLPVAIAVPPTQRAVKIGIQKEVNYVNAYKGWVDDCAIFNRLLSATEINDLYLARLVS